MAPTSPSLSVSRPGPPPSPSRRCSCCYPCKIAEDGDEGACGEFDLEAVIAKRSCLGQFRDRGGAEGLLGRGAVAQCRFGSERAPRFVSDPAERNPNILDPVTVQLQCGGDRHQREGVARPITHFAISGGLCERQRRKLDRR